jgi:hypothetical protein
MMSRKSAACQLETEVVVGADILVARLKIPIIP